MSASVRRAKPESTSARRALPARVRAPRPSTCRARRQSLRGGSRFPPPTTSRGGRDGRTPPCQRPGPAPENTINRPERREGSEDDVKQARASAVNNCCKRPTAPASPPAGLSAFLVRGATDTIPVPSPEAAISHPNPLFWSAPPRARGLGSPSWCLPETRPRCARLAPVPPRPSQRLHLTQLRREQVLARSSKWPAPQPGEMKKNEIRCHKIRTKY